MSNTFQKPQNWNNLKTTQNLSEAVKHQKRIKLYTQPILRSADQTEAHLEWLNWCRSIILEDRFQLFCDLVRYPLVTDSIINTIFSEFPRALNAKNRVINVQFSNEQLSIDFSKWLNDNGFWDWWQTESMRILAKQHESFIFFDLPAEASTNPQPYWYVVDIEAIKFVEMDGIDKVLSIAFYQNLTPEEKELYTDKFVFADKDTIKIVVTTKEGGNDLILREAKNELGYCPACKFYPKMFGTNPVDSVSPITGELSELDKYLFWETSKEYYELYGAFPIIWGYKAKCDYTDEATGVECEDGKLSFEDALTSVKHTRPCPKCQARKLIGPGSFLHVDPPASRDEADLRDPVGMVQVDAEALKYLADRQTKAKQSIIYACTGKTNVEINPEAVNELQIQASYETRRTILTDLAQTLSKTMYFMLETLSKLKYGKNVQSITADLGTEFFLQSEYELQKDYIDAKEAGLPQFDLYQKRLKIYQSENQNNPESLQRLMILNELEPFQDISLSDLKLFGINESDPLNFLIKLRFNDYIARFERENGNIIQFGEVLTFDKKISIINETLTNYAKNDYSERRQIS